MLQRKETFAIIARVQTNLKPKFIFGPEWLGWNLRSELKVLLGYLSLLQIKLSNPDIGF
jgi:hypothetical protein